MNSDANPIWTLAWTFGLMSLFAVGGANSAVPENASGWRSMCSTGMTDKQFADIFAISQLSPGPNVLIGHPDRLFRRGRCGRAGCNPCDVRSDRRPCLLCEPPVGAIEPFALACHYSGGTGSAFDRIDGRQWPDLALTSDRTWAAALITATLSGARLCHTS